MDSVNKWWWQDSNLHGLALGLGLLVTLLNYLLEIGIWGAEWGREEEEGGVKSIPSVAGQPVNVSRGCCYLNDPLSKLKTEA